MVRFTALALLLGTSTLNAQQSPLIGTWRISYPAGMRVENGVETQIVASGSLVVMPQGDSLVGTLTVEPSEDVPARPPARMAAMAVAGPATFVAQSRATININGNERETTAISTWVLEAEGDSLAGTVSRRLEGMEAYSSGAEAVVGRRTKP